MPFWDGTYTWENEKLANEFPIQVTDVLRCNSAHTVMAIVNQYEEGTPLYDLSDPHVENGNDLALQQPFFYAFFDEEAERAETLVREFIDKGLADAPKAISLFRRDTKSYQYGNGIICTEDIGDQERLRSLLPEDLRKHAKVFILPLKRYMYKCPICGHRTLQERYGYEICEECGWEDGYFFDEDDEDADNLANGTSMREYRKKYLNEKAEDPEYTWLIDVLGERK